MPPLIRFLLRHALIGFALAGVLVAVVWFTNWHGFADLVRGPGGSLALFVLTAFTGFTFASVQMGIAVMLLGGDND